MRAAVYLRVSTEQQHTDNQLPEVYEYCQSRGYEVGGEYGESESAWHNGHQKELSRLLADVKRGRRKYDVLVVWSLDRLSRLGPLAVLTLIDTFKSYGVKVESAKEPFTALPYGFDSVIYSFLAWVARYESDRRSERTKAGLARVIASGKTLGRPVGSRDRKQRRKKRPVVFKYGDLALNGIRQ